MSLTAAIQIGRSALNASQLGIQVAGNNLANAATPGYSRQVGDLVPIQGDNSNPGASVGRGVGVRSVRRQIDQALQARLMNSASDRAAADTQHNILSQVETTLGELGDNDLSSELSSYFTVWSERANQTSSSSAVIQQGQKLSQFVRRLRGELQDQRKQIDDQLSAGVGRANELLQQIGALNQSIATAEGSGATANPLRDQRDTALQSLSELMDVDVVDRGLGGVDVLVGSAPVVQGSQVRTLELKKTVVGGETQVAVTTTQHGTSQGQELTIAGGSISALLDSRTSAVNGTIDQLDAMASQLIFQVNRLHSTASNAAGLTSATGTLSIATSDRTLALNDAANQSFSSLPFSVVNGGITVTVHNRATGATESTRIRVDLDGINSAGVAGTGDDTTAEDIRAGLDAVSGISARFTPEGKLEVTADDGFDFSFPEDSSGALGVMGVNAFFTGTTGSDIGVRSDLLADPSRLSSGRMVGGVFVENGTSLRMSGLQDQGLDALGGRTLAGAWRDSVQAVGGAVSAANTNAQAKALVNDSLESQRSAISGVNIDEESIGLLNYQRQYQAAARVISTADQMVQTLLTIV